MAGVIVGIVIGFAAAMFLYGGRDVIELRAPEIGEAVEGTVRRRLHLPPMRADAWRVE